MIWLLLLQMTMAQQEALTRPSQPRHRYAVTIRARYEDGRFVSKGETRCLSPQWQSLVEAGYEQDVYYEQMGSAWVRQDFWGGTVWRTANPDTDTCEARDKDGKFGSAVIYWKTPTSVQYITVR